MKKIHFAVLLIGLLFCNGCTDHRYRWIAIGSSITWQDGRSYHQGPQKGTTATGYQSYVANKLHQKIKLINAGYSGYSLAGNEKSEYPEVIDLDYEKAELVTVFCGTNDFQLNVPIGNLSSDEHYFCGALAKLVSHIKAVSAKTKIVLFTPLQRNKSGYHTETINKVGYKLIDYVNAIKQVGAKYNLKVVDLYHKSGITKDNLAQYTIDGLHPNDKGYQLIGDVVYNEVFTDIDVNRLYH